MSFVSGDEPTKLSRGIMRPFTAGTTFASPSASRLGFIARAMRSPAESASAS